jgi:hypothetical protein
MPGAPIRAACRLATSSGVDVPKPTKVKPMSSGETPSRLARATLPFYALARFRLTIGTMA